jgi:hypothetical protein
MASLHRIEAVDPPTLARALEASWDHRTAYQGVIRPSNPAFGQCYPTSRVVQWFYPEFEIAKGEVWTGSSLEQHFWNVRGIGAHADRLDLNWQQFPSGSVVRNFVLLDRDTLRDSDGTVERCALLLERVLSYLGSRRSPCDRQMMPTADSGLVS